MPVFSEKSGKDASPGRFIDDALEIEFILSRIEQPLKNEAGKAETSNAGGEEKGIPNLPDIKSESFRPVVLMLDVDADYQIMDLGLKIALDRDLKMIGIWLPETVSESYFKTFFFTNSICCFL